MIIESLARANEGELIAIRRHLHRHPELTGREQETLKYIAATLERYQIPFIEVENGGIIAEIGDASRGKTVLLRADIDALPITESRVNLNCDKQTVSEVDGVAHACGHDAHTAMLLIAGKILMERRDAFRGRVLLLFERGEEGGGNIKYLLKYIDDTNVSIDAVHAIHVRPGLAAGKIEVRGGPIMAGASAFDVTLSGRGGHASRPDLANSPLDCFAAIYQALKDIRLRYVSPFEPLTIAVGLVSFGSKANVIADTLNFQGSARFPNPETGARFEREFRAIVGHFADAYHLEYTIASPFLGTPTINDHAMAQLSREGIRRRLGDGVAVEEVGPLMGTESFSQFTERYPGVMIHLGIDNPDVGSGSELHTARFDVDENVLKLGVVATAGFAVDFLNGLGK